MKIHRLLTLGTLGVFMMAGTAVAQNIQTDTTVNTVGSTQFGVALSITEMETIMQATPGSLDCGAGRAATGLMTCTSTTDGTATGYVRVDGMPGSFTDSAIGVISTQANFACGAVADANSCGSLFSPDSGQTVPVDANRDLVGDITMDFTIGDGGVTDGMPDGFMFFTLNPVSGAAEIDQFIDHTISLGASDMVFQQRDATIGAGVMIPDPIGDPLTLVAFASPSGPTTQPIASIGMVSRLLLAQGDADGFGGLNLDVTVDFPADSSSEVVGGWPDPGGFVTPGLNTGIGSGFDFP